LLFFFFPMYLITVCKCARHPSLNLPPAHTKVSNLSFVDFCFIKSVAPRFFAYFVGLDNFLLAVMSYDCFVAICIPYTTQRS
jgi:hypothetical protein